MIPNMVSDVDACNRTKKKILSQVASEDCVLLCSHRNIMANRTERKVKIYPAKDLWDHSILVTVRWWKLQHQETILPAT
jgi:hypothetical protein